MRFAGSLTENVLPRAISDWMASAPNKVERAP
jgi:hypothetical protein